MDEQTQPQFKQPEDTPPQPVGEYLNTVEPLQKHKKKNLIKLIIITIVLIAAAGGGAFMYLSKRPKGQPQTSAPVSEVAKPSVGITTETKRYSSSQFFLDFDQPSDWELTDELASGILKATSPDLNIPTPGGTTTGKVVLTIKGKSQKLPEFGTGNATAVIDSEKVAYTKPSSAQRGQTYLSFLSYPASSSTGLIDGVYITGDFGYTKEQAIPKVDIQKVDPVITLTFFACDGSCTKPMGITPEAWAVPEFGGALKKLLQSFTIN